MFKKNIFFNEIFIFFPAKIIENISLYSFSEKFDCDNRGHFFNEMEPILSKWINHEATSLKKYQNSKQGLVKVKKKCVFCLVIIPFIDKQSKKSSNTSKLQTDYLFHNIVSTSQGSSFQNLLIQKVNFFSCQK